MDLGTLLFYLHILGTITAVILLLVYFTGPVREQEEDYLDEENQSSDDDDQGGDDGGWRDWDPDAPLDLPPGIYTLDDAPVTVVA